MGEKNHKKKLQIVVILLLIIASVIFVYCACSKTNTSKPESATSADDKKDPNVTILKEAIHFNQHLLNCQEGYPIISTYIPDGWNTDVVMKYRISPKFPLQAVAALTSPDGKYGVICFSPMSFQDKTSLFDGTRTEDDGSHSVLEYATYYHCRNAFETSDLCLSTLGYRWTERDSYPVDSNVENEYNAGVKNKAAEAFQSQKNMLDYSGTQYKSLQLVKSEGTIDRSKGWLTNETNSVYAETTTYTSMEDIRFEATDLMLINQVYGYETINWQYDGFSIYWATDEKTFNDNYDIAQFIISNTGTTQAFAAAQDKLLSIVIPMVINGQQELSDYGASTVREVMENWNDTNDRVAQNWDDYILDQDRYSTPDGNEITVPTKADYVYYDETNGSVIWTDSALYEPGPEYQQIK